jgi:hypothetical protein
VSGVHRRAAHVPRRAAGYDTTMTKRPGDPRVHALCLAAAALAAGSGIAEAHHSIGGVYDTGRQQSVEGVVAEFQFVNPHPFVIVTVEAGGTSERWRLEMDNRFELADIGMTSETLRPGDRVVVTGSPGRLDARALYIRRLDRPADGFRYEQVGSRPRVDIAAR